MLVQSINFTNPEFYLTSTGVDILGNETLVYDGPAPEIRKVAAAAAALGSILPIQAPATNSSWNMTFPGPALTCNVLEASNGDREDIITSVQAQSNMTCSVSKSLVAYGFLSWMPQTQNNNDPCPFTSPRKDPVSGIYSMPFSGDTLSASDVDGAAWVNPLTLFVAAFPTQMISYDYNTCKGPTRDSIIVECQLYNATYNAHFNNTSGIQNVTLTAVTPGDPIVPVRDTGDMTSTNSTVAQTMAYQSVAEAFEELLFGTIGAELSDNDEATYGPTLQNTTVMSTILARTKDLAFLGNQIANLSGAAKTTASSRQPVLYDIPLAAALEELFQNITISLMSKDALE